MVIVGIGKSIIGMAVDHVESITSIPFDIIETQLDMVELEIHAPLLGGIAKMSEGELIILLNLDVVFSECDVEETLDLAQRKAEGEHEVEDEILVTKEDLQRLDIAFEEAKHSKMSNRESKKQMKDEFVKIAFRMGIENPKAQKKAEFADLIAKRTDSLGVDFQWQKWMNTSSFS